MRKRYTMTCAVCGREAEVDRRDAVTCSTKCRVALHRHPELLRRKKSIEERRARRFTAQELRAARAFARANGLKGKLKELFPAICVGGAIFGPTLYCEEEVEGSAWVRRCRIELQETRGSTYLHLLEQYSRPDQKSFPIIPVQRSGKWGWIVDISDRWFHTASKRIWPIHEAVAALNETDIPMASRRASRKKEGVTIADGIIPRRQRATSCEVFREIASETANREA
jgi:hypothetical protein